MMTKSEKVYMDKVARQSCALCYLLGTDSQGVQLHHVREGQGKGQRAQNWLVIPLCPSCHTGKNGIHGDKSLLKIAKVDEMDLLSITIQRNFEA